MDTRISRYKSEPPKSIAGTQEWTRGGTKTCSYEARSLIWRALKTPNEAEPRMPPAEACTSCDYGVCVEISQRGNYPIFFRNRTSSLRYAAAPARNSATH